MPVFDFFAEFTSTATRPWLLLALAASQSKHAKPVLHDLALDFISYSPSTPPKSPVQPPSPVQMPLELILAIIEAAYDPSVPDIVLLQSCSLVCKAWSIPVQKLLFKNVTLRNLKAYDSFLCAVGAETPSSRVLRDAVRHLRVVMDYSQPSYLHQHAFAHAVTMCPNLQELDLALYGFAEPPSAPDALGSVESSRLRRRAPSFDEETLSILRTGPSIRSLSFSNWSENQQCLFQLLDLWPGLRTLSMSGTSPHLLSSHSSTLFPGSLEELRINFQTAPSLEFLNWLLHHSTASLRSLTFERDPCPDLFEFMMETFGPDLQSLSIPNCTAPENARSIESCSQLRFFRMDRPQLNPVAYKSVPAGIKHFALGIDRDTPLQPVIDVVKSRKNLELVTIRLWNGGDNHRLLPALKIACAYRGVNLRITHDALEYKSLTRC